ncbi:MAG: HEAT repeat domain-containing protein, partial [Anaerocolumna sp.]
VGNALYTINDPRFLNDYLEIVMNESFGDSRQMIVLLLGKANYRNAAVKNVLLQLLNDYKVANHALEALAKFKDPELYEMIQSYVSETEKEKFLRTMKQLKEENPDNDGIQKMYPKGMWSWRVKTARKFKKEY